MSASGSEFPTLHKVILAVIGLWPLRYPVVKHMLTVNAYFLCVTTVAVQVFLAKYGIAGVVKSKHDLLSLTSALSCMLQVFIGVLKYVTFHVKAREIEWLRALHKSTWNILHEEKESADIMRKYVTLSRRLTALVTIGGYFTLILCLILQFLPSIRNLMVSPNESQWYEVDLFGSDYLVDRQKYIIPILIHTTLGYFVVVTSVFATESATLLHVLHVCALFKIAGFVLENAIDDEMMQAPLSTGHAVIQRRIEHAVKVHKWAYELADAVWSTFVSSYFILTWMLVVEFGLSLFRLSRSLVVEPNIKEFIFSLWICGVPSSYMFVATFFGQKLKDHSIHVFHSTYQSRWYEAPVKIQRLFLSILVRSGKEVTYASGGVFIITLEGFTALINMSVSYFMLLHSLH